MHLSRALTAKLATCILAGTAVITPSFAASVGTVVSDSGLNVRAEASAEAHMRAWGVEVTTLSAAEKARFRAAVEPLYARFGEQSGLLQRIRES